MGSLSMDLPALDYPVGTFAHPDQVVRDLRLTRDEKRAILASWASDACAVEAAPALRRVPDGRLVTIDEVMEALRLLDREAVSIHEPPNYRQLPQYQRGLYRRMFAGASGGCLRSSVN
jgi:hypothetical protein